MLQHSPITMVSYRPETKKQSKCGERKGVRSFLSFPSGWKKKLVFHFEQYCAPLVPLGIFAFLMLCAFSFLTHVIPHFSNKFGIWTVQTAYLLIPFSVLSFLVLFTFFRAMTLSPGDIPREWRDWDGSLSFEPEIPRYARISSRWKSLMEDVKKQRKDSLVQALVSQSSNFKPPKCIDYGRGAPKNAVPGVLVVDEGEPCVYDSMEFSVLEHSTNCSNEDECHGHGDSNQQHLDEVERESHPLNLPPEAMQSLLKSIQWGNVSEEEQNQAERDLEQGSFSSIRMDTLVPEPDSSNESAYCSKHKCSNFRPPRSHHCRRCRQCVERMDHHCVWINNCVGLGNHKPFFLFLCYFIVCIAAYIFMSVRLFLTHEIYDATNVFIFCVAIPAFYFIGMLLDSQVRNILNNNTEMEKMFAAPEMLSKYRMPTWKENVSIVLGDSVLRWGLPF